MSVLLYVFKIFGLRNRLGLSQDVHYFLLLLSSGSMFKPLQTALSFYTTYRSLHQTHTSTAIFPIVMSLQISSIVKVGKLDVCGRPFFGNLFIYVHLHSQTQICS